MVTLFPKFFGFLQQHEPLFQAKNMNWGTSMTSTWLITQTGPKLKNPRTDTCSMSQHSGYQQGAGDDFVGGSATGDIMSIRHQWIFTIFYWQQGNDETLDLQFLSPIRERVMGYKHHSVRHQPEPSFFYLGLLQLSLLKQVICWNWTSSRRSWHFSTEKNAV